MAKIIKKTDEIEQNGAKPKNVFRLHYANYQLLVYSETHQSTRPSTHKPIQTCGVWFICCYYCCLPVSAILALFAPSECTKRSVIAWRHAVRSWPWWSMIGTQSGADYRTKDGGNETNRTVEKDSVKKGWVNNYWALFRLVLHPEYGYNDIMRIYEQTCVCHT